MQSCEWHHKFRCGDGSLYSNNTGVWAAINWGSSALDINRSIHSNTQIVDEGDINWACVCPIAATRSNNVLSCIEKDKQFLSTKQSCCVCHADFTISNVQLLSNNCYKEHFFCSTFVGDRLALSQVVNLQGWMDHGTNEDVLTLESTAYYGQFYLSSRALKLVGTTPWMCSALLGFNNRNIITWGSILGRLW